MLPFIAYRSGVSLLHLCPGTARLARPKSIFEGASRIVHRHHRASPPLLHHHPFKYTHEKAIGMSLLRLAARRTRSHALGGGASGLLRSPRPAASAALMMMSTAPRKGKVSGPGKGAAMENSCARAHVRGGSRQEWEWLAARDPSGSPLKGRTRTYVRTYVRACTHPASPPPQN